MDIGSMKQRITIQKQQTVVDGIGNHTSKWTGFHGCFAYVNLASANENGTQPTVRSEDAKRGGGRVEGITHIAPAEEYAVEELEAEIRKGLK